MNVRRLTLLPFALLLAASGCASSTSPPPTLPNASSPSSNGTASNTTARTVGWVLVGVGAQAGAVALGTGALMLDADATRSDECDANKACSQDGLDANKRIENLSPWNVGAFVVSGVALAGGLFLVLTNPREQRRIGVAPGPLGAVLKATF